MAYTKKSNFQKNMEKAIKKSHKAYLVIAVIFLLIGGVLGVFLAQNITKNDCFTLIGNKETTLKIGDTENTAYSDEGVKYIKYGKDLSKSVEIITNMEKNENGDFLIDTSVAGEYYITYKITEGIDVGIQKYRVFKVVGGEQ